MSAKINWPATIKLKSTKQEKQQNSKFSEIEK